MKAFAVLISLALGLAAQSASFTNLGFDEADTSTVTPQPGPIFSGTGPAADLLPGWELYQGQTLQSTLGLNLSSLAPGYATLISADTSGYFQYPVEGKYGLFLSGAAGNQEPFSLFQRGEIPSDARVLSLTYSGYAFSLSVNGVIQNPATLTTSFEAFDVGQFGGQTVDLRLTALGPLMPTALGSSYIDSVAFAVPEPEVLALWVAAAGLWLLRKR